MWFGGRKWNAGFRVIQSKYTDAPPMAPVGACTSVKKVNLIHGKIEKEEDVNRTQGIVIKLAKITR